MSLDTDRVLRAFAALVQATLRTNYYVTAEGSARQRNALSFKLNPQLIDELPLPRPKYEIFVYSPRVEGVHLRFGNVALAAACAGRTGGRTSAPNWAWSRRRR